MLAIDELNNVGWFVSDRFQEEDKVDRLFIYSEYGEKDLSGRR